MKTKTRKKNAMDKGDEVGGLARKLPARILSQTEWGYLYQSTLGCGLSMKMDIDDRKR